MDVKNELGAVPLHYAVISGRLDIVTALLRAGADARIGARNGETPVSLAEKMSNTD